MRTWRGGLTQLTMETQDNPSCGRTFMLSRVVELSRAGEAFRASVESGAPEFEQGVWRGRWSLNPEPVLMAGEDALEGLLRSLRFVGKFRRAFEEDEWRIKWQHFGSHGGFPPLAPLWECEPA